MLCRCRPDSACVADGRAHPRDEVLDLRRIRVAGGVRQADLVAARRHQLLRRAARPCRPARRPRACSRTPSTGRPRTSAGAPAGSERSSATMPRVFVEHLRVRAPHVLQAVRLGDRQRDRDLVRAGRDGGLGAAQVRHQHGDRQPRDRARECDDLGGVGQLRQQLRRHEAADLDLADAGGGLGAIQAFFAASGMIGAMLCRPSRGPTSLTRMSHCVLVQVDPRPLRRSRSRNALDRRAAASASGRSRRAPRAASRATRRRVRSGATRPAGPETRLRGEVHRDAMRCGSGATAGREPRRCSRPASRTGRMPLRTQLPKKIGEKLGAITARMPYSCSAQTACSRLEPQPKFSPPSMIRAPA